MCHQSFYSRLAVSDDADLVYISEIFLPPARHTGGEWSLTCGDWIFHSNISFPATPGYSGYSPDITVNSLYLNRSIEEILPMTTLDHKLFGSVQEVTTPHVKQSILVLNSCTWHRGNSPTSVDFSLFWFLHIFVLKVQSVRFCWSDNTSNVSLL